MSHRDLKPENPPDKPLETPEEMKRRHACELELTKAQMRAALEPEALNKRMPEPSDPLHARR